jgi:hypothetical protein
MDFRRALKPRLHWRTGGQARSTDGPFQHVREILPTADIAHDPRGVRELSGGPASFERLRIAGSEGEALTLDRALEATNTDGSSCFTKARSGWNAISMA